MREEDMEDLMGLLQQAINEREAGSPRTEAGEKITELLDSDSNMERDFYTATEEELESGRIFEEIPRSMEDVQTLASFLTQQLWWIRHNNWKDRVEAGEDTADPGIWKGALEAAARVEEEYGDVLDPDTEDDYEAGFRCGKLAALVWVLGGAWYCALDT